MTNGIAKEASLNLRKSATNLAAADASVKAMRSLKEKQFKVKGMQKYQA